MPANLRQVENIILSGEIADSIMIDNDVRQNFNVIQMEEERQKLQFTKEHPEHSAGLFSWRITICFKVVQMLLGMRILIFISDSSMSLIDARDIIDCAMLATYDYSQRINNWCIQLGSGNQDEIGNKAWYALFHPTGKNPDFNKTKNHYVLCLRLI